MMFILSMAIFLLILIFSITLHEYAHGWIAYKLGDPTPKIQGRLSLNPLVHIDFLGTIILPFLIVFISQGLLPPIGRAKPVPINPYHFKNPRKDMMFVSIAGPLTNLIIALILIALIKLKLPLFSEILAVGLILNLILLIINLIPIPPLDGSRILAAFLPPKQYYSYRKLEKFGFLIVVSLVIVFVLTGLFGKFILFLRQIVFSL